MQSKNPNRQYKDVLFKYVLRDKKDLLELYNAINDSDYDNPEELEYNTLEDALMTNSFNTYSFMVK